MQHIREHSQTCRVDNATGDRAARIQKGGCHSQASRGDNIAGAQLGDELLATCDVAEHPELALVKGQACQSR